MSRPKLELLRRHRTLVAVTILQALCGIAFVIDALSEIDMLSTNPLHPLSEGLVVVALWTGSFLGVREIARLLRSNVAMQSRLRAAQGAFANMLEDLFREWGLTSSERDVAILMLKGLSVSEIGDLRQTRPGTVKAQCAAIYRKAGVNSRSQLLSVLIDDLLSGLSLEPVPAPGPEAVA